MSYMYIIYTIYIYINIKRVYIYMASAQLPVAHFLVPFCNEHGNLFPHLLVPKQPQFPPLYVFLVQMAVSKIGVPQNGWFIMEDLGVPLFLETPKSTSEKKSEEEKRQKTNTATTVTILKAALGVAFLGVPW